MNNYMEQFMRDNYETFEDMPLVKDIEREHAKKIFEDIEKILYGKHYHKGIYIRKILSMREFEELKKKYTKE